MIGGAAVGEWAIGEGDSPSTGALVATRFDNVNTFGAHTLTLAGGPQVLTATRFTNTNTFGAHVVQIVSGGASAAAVWDHPLEGGFTAGDILRIIAAAVAGRVSISGNTVTFTGLDGSTVRITGTVDGSGNRNSVSHDGDA
ncbi:hypothetical protein [Roseateles sp.]|uniref:hypothetical protein n=1 Tax=Roseateles sp. TaxID=1971397 RepID=UPI002E061AF6|nr:hypothetical protein [Roseateles sp.]